MHLEAPKNPNYAATVVQVRHLIPLANADNLVGFPIMGMQAVVGKDTQIGEVGILIPTECQFSKEFCTINNLYRHSELNDDKTRVGYLEDNRRVRAIKLRGHRSDALFMPLSSLTYCDMVVVAQLQEGDTFDVLNGHEICRKYEIERRMPGLKSQQRVKSRVDSRFMPEHFDSENFFRVSDRLDPDDWCVLTQKIHGTSIRVANTIVERKLSLIERLAKKVGVRVREQGFDNVYGSRKVIKDVNNPNQQHFYATGPVDLWTREGRKLDGLIPENYIVYGELIGWADKGTPIQHNYTYDLPQGECQLYVYRVAIVNGQGIVADLSWDALKEFCRERGLKWVPELARVRVSRLLDDANQLLDELLDVKLLADGPSWFVDRPIALSPGSPCDEGVCIRIEGIIPRIYKAKSPMFLQHETKLLDKEQMDMESSQVDGGADEGP